MRKFSNIKYRIRSKKKQKREKEGNRLCERDGQGESNEQKLLALSLARQGAICTNQEQTSIFFKRKKEEGKDGGGEEGGRSENNSRALKLNDN